MFQTASAMAQLFATNYLPPTEGVGPWRGMAIRTPASAFEQLQRPSLIHLTASCYDGEILICLSMNAIIQKRNELDGWNLACDRYTQIVELCQIPPPSRIHLDG
ncbi:hypothetical protein AVEN_139693-1 [Araneus ventricosus]|uniref:Uncharacterized protein n=1 Tax=Araneus ventricosus TaxID=182803 RepID=A0A4Y1ZPE4_ARAVE|nr:hypothetical protein AVEN_261730-1 [Araneus ventricosus]GBL61396.1 hypothetical protein AVEN_233345-1 [Araneus ventricosus]GBL61493.1 hypothetical protein AVEN_91797-1 [Araneus ventricosus]GBL61517.1 hypothetical protein AVEN_139693-1 [Araneus ventricosus]